MKSIGEELATNTDWMLREYAKQLGLEAGRPSGPFPLPRLAEIQPSTYAPGSTPALSAVPLEQPADEMIRPLPSVEELDAAAEATLAAVSAGPVNSHPVGSPEHAEFEAVLASMRKAPIPEIVAAFEAAEAKARAAAVVEGDTP